MSSDSEKGGRNENDADADADNQLWVVWFFFFLHSAHACLGRRSRIVSLERHNDNSETVRQLSVALLASRHCLS